MIISERNLKEVCTHLVDQYKNGRSTKEQSIQAFRGLSLLLVSYKEKQNIDSAILQIRGYAEKQEKKAVENV